MTFPASVDTVPLERWDDGSIRVTGSRVTLDTIVSAWRRGESPEGIQEMFPTLALADIYDAIAYYLRNIDEVTQYLTARSEEAKQLRVEVERRFPQSDLRSRLLARQAQKRAQPE